MGMMPNCSASCELTFRISFYLLNNFEVREPSEDKEN